MKEKIQNTKMFDENMKEKRAISKEIGHKRKSDNNISFSDASTNRETNCDKRKINPNKNDSKAVQELLTSKEFDGKALRENKNTSFLDDDWTLKELPCSENKYDTENFGDIKKRKEIKNEYNILIEYQIKNNEISRIRQFGNNIIFKIILIELALIIGRLQNNIQFFSNEFVISYLVQSISLDKNNEIYNKFILAFSIIINRRMLNNIIFYININICVVMKRLNNIFKNECMIREEKRH